MKNYKMIVSYDGTRYSGWEHQPGKDLTIQGKLESVLEAMETGEHPDAQPRRITVIGAGRTDAGVHARAMTCNALLETDKTEEEIQAYLDHIRLLHADAAAKLGKALRVPWVWLMGVGDDAFPQQ